MLVAVQSLTLKELHIDIKVNKTKLEMKLN